MTTALLTDAVTADPARAVRLALLWGLDAVALRSVGGGRVPNVTEGPLRRRLADAELPVAALDPGLFEGTASARAGWLNDLDALDEVAPFAQRIGCDVIRVGALAADEADGAAEALAQAGERAARHGLRLAVRNDAESAVATGADLADLLAAVAHPSVGADWRPADAFVVGEDPADGLAEIVASAVAVVSVGVRDGAIDDGAWVEATVGEGDIGWREHLVSLARAGFEGALVLEGLPEPARTAGLASATALIRLARAATRGR